jgi:hypothetical protein
LTVESYTWSAALNFFKGRFPNVPLVSFVHTKEESKRDEEAMVTHGFVLIARLESKVWPSLFWRQSGTIATDLFRKNRWISIYK